MPDVLPMYNEGSKTKCNGFGLNYHDIWLLLTEKSLCNINRSRLIPYGDEIIVDCQYGFVARAESLNLLGPNKNATNNFFDVNAEKI